MAQQDTATNTGGLQVKATSRRLGRFTIHDDLLRESINNGLAARLFYGSVPLDVQRDWLPKKSSFLLWHPKFDDVPLGSIVPEYIAVVENGVITWERVEDNAGTASPLTTERFAKLMEGGAA